MSRAAQIIQDVVGSHDRAFGKDDPTLSLKLGQELSEVGGLGQGLERAVGLEFAGFLVHGREGLEAGEQKGLGAGWAIVVAPDGQ